MIRGSWCSKSRLAKAAGAEVAVQQTGEKWPAAVAKTILLGQNAQNTSWSEHFLTFRCWKMARRCGENHIVRSKCAKHLMVGALFDVPMLKNGTPLWREAHFQVKMHKTPQSRTNFGSSDVQKWHAAVARSTLEVSCQKSHAAVARSTFAGKNVENTCVLQHFETFLTDSLTN